MKKTLLILLTAIILVCSCSCKNTKEPDPIDTTEIKTSEDTTEIKTSEDTTEIETSEDTTESVSDKFYVSDAESYEIETPYGPIYYPTVWKDKVVTEISDNDTSYGIKFSAQLDGKSIPLYTVVFGEKPESYMTAGTLISGEKAVRVYFVDHSAEGLNADLTETSMQTYLTMCEDINVIISKLVYTNGMELD